MTSMREKNACDGKSINVNFICDFIWHKYFEKIFFQGCNKSLITPNTFLNHAVPISCFWCDVAHVVTPYVICFSLLSYTFELRVS